MGTCAAVYSSSVVEDATAQYLANYVYQQTGILRSVILAQILFETGGLTSAAWNNCHNPAGITGNSEGVYCDGGFQYYPTWQATAEGYVATYRNGYYPSVLQAAQSGAGYEAICRALGQSPWAGSHYACNGIPGEILIQTIQLNNLTRFDTSSAHPTSAPPGPNCSAQTLAALGSYVGSGSAAGVEAGLYVFQRAANGSIINTVVNDACQVVAVYPHGGSTSATVPVPSTPSIITRIVQSVNWWYVAGGIAVGVVGLYAIEKTGLAKKFRWW